MPGEFSYTPATNKQRPGPRGTPSRSSLWSRQEGAVSTSSASSFESLARGSAWSWVAKGVLPWFPYRRESSFSLNSLATNFFST